MRCDSFSAPFSRTTIWSHSVRVTVVGDDHHRPADAILAELAFTCASLSGSSALVRLVEIRIRGS